MKSWTAFWIFLAVFYIGDTFVYFKGYNTFFWKYKTLNELAAQRQKLGLNADDGSKNESQ